MFLNVFILIAFIMPAMLAKPFSDDSEVLLSIVGDDEAKAKRQAEFFDSIQGAIEKYEKSADEHLAPLKLLNNNYKPYDTFVYPNVQQPYLRNTNYPTPNSMSFDLYTQQQKNTGYSQAEPSEPLFNANRQYMPYMGLNYRILPPIYMPSGFGSIPRTRIYNPQHLQEVASASAIFLGDQIVNVERPSYKCSKEIIKSTYNNKLNENKTETEKQLKIIELAQPSSTTERSFEIQKVTQNQILTRVAVIARGGNEKNVKEMPKNIKTLRLETTTRDNSTGVKSSTLTRTEKSSNGSLTIRGQIQSRKALNLNTKNISENSSTHKNRSSNTTSNFSIRQQASETLLISSRNQLKQNSINLANIPELRAPSVDFTSTTSDEMDADNSTTEIPSTTQVTITESPLNSSTDDETITSTTTISTDTTPSNTDDGNSTIQSSTVTSDSTQDPSTETTEMPRSNTTQYYYTKKQKNYSLTNKYKMKNIESSKNSSNYSSSSLRRNKLRTNNAQLRTTSLSNNGKFKSVNVRRKSTKLADKYIEAQEVENIKTDNSSPNKPYTDCMCGTDSNQVNVLQRPQNKDPYAAPILSETYSVKYPEFKSNSPASSTYWHKIEDRILNQPKVGDRQTWQIKQTKKYDDNDSPELEIYSKEDDYGNLYETGEREEHYFT